MYNTSTAYKTEIRNTLRNPSYVRVKLSVIEPDAKTNGVLTSNGEIYYSDVTDISYNTDNIHTNNTLEYNRFFLDGLNPLSPVSGETPYDINGFIGTEISDEDGLYSTNPKITVDFGIYSYDFIGLTLDFDTILNEYPHQINVKGYNDTVNVFDETYVVTKSSGFQISEYIPTCDILEIIALDSRVPFRRFRVENIYFGYNQMFYNEDISKLTWKQAVDIINSKLPQVSFDFTAFDTSIPPIYDPENPTGMYYYLQERQPAKLEFGYELNDGSIEWIECANLFTSGEFNFASNGSIPTIEFKCKSLLNLMTRVYDVATYTPTPITLYDLAEDLLQWYGLPKDEDGNDMYVLDTSLQSYTTTMPLPSLPTNTLLQLIANAGMCVLYTDRNGYIRIDPKSAVEETFVYDKANMFELPSIKIYPNLQGVDTLVNSLNIDTASSELSKQTITDATNDTFSFTYDLAKDITVVGDFAYTKRTISTATASSRYSSTYTPAKAYDADGATYWRSLNKTLPQYITYDLGANYPVAKVNVYINVAGYVTETFDIQCSTDGTNFTDVYTNASITTTGTSYTSFEFTATTARYIRLNMKTSAGSYFVVSETEIYSGTGLQVIGTPTIYGRKAIVVLKGTGDLTISGKKITVKSQNLSVEVADLGERCSISNSLIMTPTHATAFANWVADYISRKNQYTLVDRGFPEVDALDNVTIDTVYTDGVRADVLSSEIEFNGALSGKTILMGE